MRRAGRLGRLRVPRIFVAAALGDVSGRLDTQPTDENGGGVGKVLHVGTGEPRLMVVNVATVGQRLYTGMVASYFEATTGGLDRPTDERWRVLVELRRTQGAWPPDVEGPHPPSDVRWMRDLIGPLPSR